MIEYDFVFGIYRHMYKPWDRKLGKGLWMMKFKVGWDHEVYARGNLQLHFAFLDGLDE